jgi:WD40 repeat protein
VLVGVFLIAAIINGGLAYWANGQREEALRQASIGLASQAQLELNGTSPERGVLLALEALEKYPYTWQAEKALGEIVHDFRLRRILSAHTAIVSDVAWSPDGRYVATSSRDGTVRIWDTTSWTEPLVIQAHAAFDPGFTDNQSGTGESGVRAVVWSPDGKQIVTLGNTDSTANVWNVKTREKITSFTLHKDWVLSASWSPDSKSIVTSGKDGSVFIWDSITGEVKFEFPMQTAPIQMVGWSPDGRLIATAGDEGLIKIWDSKTSDELNILTGHEGIIWSVSWSPDGTQLASAGEDGTIRIWDIAKGEEVSDIRSSSAFWHVVWSYDGSQLATTNVDGLAQVWNVSTLGEAFSLLGRTESQFTIAWSPNGEWLATTSGTDSVVRVWDVSPEPVVFPAMHTEQAGWVMWSPDGSQLATAADDFSSIIWDANTGDPIYTLTGHTNWIQQALWSPDGSKIATASWDNTVKLWDAKNGKEISTFTGHSADPINRLFGFQGILNLVWSPDGTRVASQGLTGWVRVWEIATGTELFAFQTNADLSEPMSWSADGSKIATCAVPQILQIWDAHTGEPIIGGFVNNTTNLTFQDFISFCVSAAWSPDGERIVTGGWDESVTVWNAKTGDKILSFPSYGQPDGLTWSQNGERIAAGENSGVVKIWDSNTGVELLSFKTTHPFLFTVDWSPDGSRLAGAGGLFSPSVWRVWQTTEDLIAYAKECCVVRELTPEERQQFGLR